MDQIQTALSQFTTALQMQAEALVSLSQCLGANPELEEENECLKTENKRLMAENERLRARQEELDRWQQAYPSPASPIVNKMSNEPVPPIVNKISIEYASDSPAANTAKSGQSLSASWDSPHNNGKHHPPPVDSAFIQRVRGILSKIGPDEKSRKMAARDPCLRQAYLRFFPNEDCKSFTPNHLQRLMNELIGKNTLQNYGITEQVCSTNGKRSGKPAS
jgi:FtsZ-binding cell division protein ZapB